MPSETTVREKTQVVFCWHMHQPEYRNLLNGTYYFPWTYLHAIKDYVDMAAHLEAHLDVHAVFNFAPILLEQLDDYAQQIDDYLHGKGSLRDPMLAALVDDKLPEPDTSQFTELARNCLRANEARILNRFPAFTHLAQMVASFEEDSYTPRYLNPQFLIDLVVWYHLGWMGETVRRSEPRIQQLQSKEGGFTPEERRQLLEIIGAQMSSLKPRYRALVERGQIEISMSPFAHPIVPLLLDLESTRQAMPDVCLPDAPEYPGGEARARWHMERGIASFENYFGFRPAGCWASEGALSDATLKLISEYGFTWTATGDSVLHNSLRHKENHAATEGLSYHHRAFQFADAPVHCFFRDDGLSDLIGFTYFKWHAEDAVGDLLHRLEKIAKSNPEPGQGVISIIMDGENAWEHYPENAWYFMDELYSRLADHPHLETTTYSRLLERNKANPKVLKHLVAGSWVYGTFSTWIGDADKNRGWNLLCEAKNAYDRKVDQLNPEQRARAEEQLAICEGSDWFWWFGDYNPADSVQDFESLFRHHLHNLYTLIDEPVPDALTHVISTGSGKPSLGGVMRHGHAEDEKREAH